MRQRHAASGDADAMPSRIPTSPPTSRSQSPGSYHSLRRQSEKSASSPSSSEKSERELVSTVTLRQGSEMEQERMRLQDLGHPAGTSGQAWEFYATHYTECCSIVGQAPIVGQMAVR